MIAHYSAGCGWSECGEGVLIAGLECACEKVYAGIDYNRQMRPNALTGSDPELVSQRYPLSCPNDCPF
jgi:hypothetical protein